MKRTENSQGVSLCGIFNPCVPDGVVPALPDPLSSSFKLSGPFVDPGEVSGAGAVALGACSGW